MAATREIKWLDAPEDHDYPAARAFLSLIFEADDCDRLIEKLKVSGPSISFSAKDIFRASRLSLLAAGNSHVEKDRQKIDSGKPLSPLLLIRDPRNAQVIIADGYHRLCAVYSYDEDADIKCRIV